MTLTYLQMALAVLSDAGGGGFSLGPIGGGGSILAVPLLVYVVGIPSAHVAIGTSAVAVALNAGLNLTPLRGSRLADGQLVVLFVAGASPEASWESGRGRGSDATRAQ